MVQISINVKPAFPKAVALSLLPVGTVKPVRF